MLNQYTSISPIDGRYHDKTKNLSKYISESALIKYIIYVEVKYLIEIDSRLNLNIPNILTLQDIYVNFSEDDVIEIKNIEKKTNHDVKAVEYFIKNKLETLGLSEFKEFIHFGLTSQDINNTAIPLSLKEGIETVYLPNLLEIVSKLAALANEWRDIPMLARTHGQPASPTRLGKEIQVFQERLEIQIKQLAQVPYSGKFGGATGNFNAHLVAYPPIDWVDFANKFLNSLGLSRSQTTTQIDHYDNLAALFDCLKRINTILLDLSKDFWLYISMDYFKQKLKEGEIGSSAMPHKVNPIDFENAEGNIGIANAHFEHLSAKLPVSRLQRDLTDSTVLRTIGVPIAHTLIALKSLESGLTKLLLNEAKFTQDLEANWAVVAEAIQTILRKEKFDKPYEALKNLTRKNEAISKESVHEFIENLNVSDGIKSQLKLISPLNYLGIQLVKK